MQCMNKNMTIRVAKWPAFTLSNMRMSSNWMTTGSMIASYTVRKMVTDHIDLIYPGFTIICAESNSSKLDCGNCGSLVLCTVYTKDFPKRWTVYIYVILDIYIYIYIYIIYVHLDRMTCHTNNQNSFDISYLAIHNNPVLDQLNGLTNHLSLLSVERAWRNERNWWELIGEWFDSHKSEILLWYYCMVMFWEKLSYEKK